MDGCDPYTYTTKQDVAGTYQAVSEALKGADNIAAVKAVCVEYALNVKPMKSFPADGYSPVASLEDGLLMSRTSFPLEGGCNASERSEFVALSDAGLALAIRVETGKERSIQE